MAKLKNLGWNKMFDQIIWKNPAEKKVKAAKDKIEEFYDGDGNLIEQLTSVSNGSGGIQRVVIGYSTLINYPDSFRNLANQLTGISAFSPYGLTDIFDINGNLLFSELKYDSLNELADSMIKSEVYQNMFFVVHYFNIDRTYKTPKVFAKNLAYWTLVGKPNYTNQRTPWPVSMYFRNLREPDSELVGQTTAHLSICNQIALYLSNYASGWYGGDSLSADQVSDLIFPSNYHTLFNWPNLRAPLQGPSGVIALWNSEEISYRTPEIKKEAEDALAKGKPKPKVGSVFPMQDSKWSVLNVHQIDISFDNQFKAVSYIGRKMWQNNAILIREEPQRIPKVWQATKENIKAIRLKKREIESESDIEIPVEAGQVQKAVSKEGAIYTTENTAYSSILLFEITNTDSFQGYDKGAWRYFIAKPLGEDFFSVKQDVIPFKEDYVYLLIEENGKKPKLERVILSTEQWSHLFLADSFGTSKNWIGNFNYLSLPIANWSNRFKNYITKTTSDSITNNFRIKILLAKDDDAYDRGYFIQPSDNYITIEKTTIKGINQIRIKNIGS